MTLALALLASAALAQADATAESTAESTPTPSAFELHKAHVGAGHFTFGTSGGFSANPASTPFDTSSFGFSLFANGGYFVLDRLLLGGHLGFSVSSFGNGAGGVSVSAGIPFGIFGEYWHPLTERIFLFAGASVALSPSFGAGSGVYWSVSPHAGVAFFFNDWLALQPTLSVSIGPSINVSVGWGMAYYL